MADNITLNTGTGGAIIRTDDDGSFHWQYNKIAFGADNTQTIVTSTVGLPVKLLAGTAEIGKLAAGTASIGVLGANSGVDIGDVDVTSVPAPLSTTGGGTEAAALRITVASDSTGVLSVDDNGGALTVDNGGTFATQATLQAGTAEVGKLAAGVAEIGNVKNSGTFAVQSTLQTGSNAIGKLAANSGVDIGDVDVISVPRSISGPAEPGTVIDSYTHVAINLTTGADQVLVASAANKQIWVYGYGFTCGDADGQTVSLQDQDDATLTGIMEFAQYGGISVPPSGNFSMPIFKLGTDKDLEIDITGGDVDGFVCYSILSV